MACAPHDPGAYFALKCVDVCAIFSPDSVAARWDLCSAE